MVMETLTTSREPDKGARGNQCRFCSNAVTGCTERGEGLSSARGRTRGLHSGPWALREEQVCWVKKDRKASQPEGMAAAKAQRGTKHDVRASGCKREEERQEWVDGEGQGQVTATLARLFPVGQHLTHSK